jgi:hypothetical protein
VCVQHRAGVTSDRNGPRTALTAGGEHDVSGAGDNGGSEIKALRAWRPLAADLHSEFSDGRGSRLGT